MLGIVSIIIFILVPKWQIRAICAIVWVAGIIIFPDTAIYHVLGSAVVAGITLFIRWLVRKYGKEKV